MRPFLTDVVVAIPDNSAEEINTALDSYTEISSKIGRSQRQLCSKLSFFGGRCVYEHYCPPKKKTLESFLGYDQFLS